MARLARLASLIAKAKDAEPTISKSEPKSESERPCVLDPELWNLPYRLDPRPDLAEDHRDWMAVLAVAETEDLRLHGLLHGLRCGGARLELRDGAKGPYYRIDYKPLLEVWDEQELRETWLEPHRRQIKQVLDRGLMIKRAADRRFGRK